MAAISRGPALPRRGRDWRSDNAGRGYPLRFLASVVPAARVATPDADPGQTGTVNFVTSKSYTRAVLPPTILACSSSGTPARISARIFRDCGNVDSLCG